MLVVFNDQSFQSVGNYLCSELGETNLC